MWNAVDGQILPQDVISTQLEGVKLPSWGLRTVATCYWCGSGSGAVALSHTRRTTGMFSGGILQWANVDNRQISTTPALRFASR
jgi:hypothetical protein